MCKWPKFLKKSLTQSNLVIAIAVKQSRILAALTILDHHSAMRLAMTGLFGVSGS
jgi:hypothetical protein